MALDWQDVGLRLRGLLLIEGQSKHTSKQPHKQTRKQARKQTRKQSRKQTRKQTLKQTRHARLFTSISGASFVSKGAQ